MWVVSPVFRFSDLGLLPMELFQVATRNFASSRKIGENLLGEVFKGSLFKSSVVVTRIHEETTAFQRAYVSEIDDFIRCVCVAV